jgi:hypothetical protein
MTMPAARLTAATEVQPGDTLQGFNNPNLKRRVNSARLATETDAAGSREWVVLGFEKGPQLRLSPGDRVKVVVLTGGQA